MRTKRVVDPNPSPLFENEIPKRVRDEVKIIVDQTKKDEREKSITFCVLQSDPDKIHTSNYAKGLRGSTEVKPCNEKKYGKSDKIGDMHTHPSGGIIHSEGDFYANLSETGETKKKQVSCVSNHESKFINCIYPKSIPDSKKIRKYENALDNTTTDNDVDPYFRQNIGKDFDHLYFNRKTYKKQKPTKREVVSDAFGTSTTRLRDSAIHDIEKGTFCDLVADYQVGRDDHEFHDQVTNECKRVLKKRKFQPFSFENILFGKTK